MKHWWIVLSALLLVSCHDNLETPVTKLKHVVVVYMMAENGLSNLAQADLNEMRKAMSDIPDSCQLVVYFDNSRSDIKPQIIRFSASGGEKVLHEYRNDGISTDSLIMQHALDFIIQSCPAKRYSLVMWSHGSGWIPSPNYTIGVDNGTNSSTSDVGKKTEIHTLANVLANTKAKWDYIFFDACFMQCAEVAYALRHVTDWCIGSPAEIPGKGAPYDYIMKDLFCTPEDAWQIALQYHKFYEDYGGGNGVVLSAIDTRQLEDLARATAPCISGRSEFPVDGIQTYCTYAYRTGWMPEYFDIGSAMGKWLEASDYARWCEALNKAVPHRYLAGQWDTSYGSVYSPRLIDAGHAAGMSFYLPMEGRDVMNTAFTLTEWYADCGWE